jgi:hypothetical protein
MIELNCTYEESKKIRELGYDFSAVCWRFELRDYMGLSKFFVRLDEELAIEVDTETDHLNWNGLRNWCESYKMGQFTIPIIPKAALEACLPDRLQIETQKLGYTEIEECYPGKELGYGQYNYWYSSNGKPFNSRCFKDGVYEAFLWCHENYPEELKAKFGEVMA